MDKHQKFYSLLRYSVDDKASVPSDITAEDWPDLFGLSRKHALVGVVHRGVCKLPHEMQPEKDIAVRWYVLSERNTYVNQMINEAVTELFTRFDADGFRCCVLKGQGNSLLYPDVYMRTPGDFDAWLEGSDDDVIRYVKKINPNAKATYHHVDYPSYKRMPVEAHYRPSFQFNFIHNNRLQKWFRDNAKAQFENIAVLPDCFGPVSVPTVRFNRVFQMSHIANHVLHEGLGLRQLLDYYFLLRTGFSEDEKCEYAALMRRFGMYKMSRAVMYVLREVFGLEEELLIVEPHERCGRMLLEEIMLAGNFGHYDERISKADRKNRLRMNMMRLKRDLRMVRYFPSECFSEPLFRIYHFFWRLVKN